MISTSPEGESPSRRRAGARSRGDRLPANWPAFCSASCRRRGQRSRRGWRRRWGRCPRKKPKLKHEDRRDRGTARVTWVRARRRHGGSHERTETDLSRFARERAGRSLGGAYRQPIPGSRAPRGGESARTKTGSISDPGRHPSDPSRPNWVPSGVTESGAARFGSMVRTSWPRSAPWMACSCSMAVHRTSR